jgi:hypothetical protein
VIDIPVLVTGSTELRDASGATMTADAFFAMAAGHDVTVSAVKQGSTVVAISVRMDY